MVYYNTSSDLPLRPGPGAMTINLMAFAAEVERTRAEEEIALKSLRNPIIDIVSRKREGAIDRG